jgi:hypothetical protein
VLLFEQRHAPSPPECVAAFFWRLSLRRSAVDRSYASSHRAVAGPTLLGSARSCPRHPSVLPNVNAKSWSAKGRAGARTPRARTSTASLAGATSTPPSSRHAQPARPGSPASMGRDLRRVAAASWKHRLGSTSTIVVGSPRALPTRGIDSGNAARRFWQPFGEHAGAGAKGYGLLPSTFGRRG